MAIGALGRRRPTGPAESDRRSSVLGVFRTYADWSLALTMTMAGTVIVVLAWLLLGDSRSAVIGRAAGAPRSTPVPVGPHTAAVDHAAVVAPPMF